jgi:hypothetical protein
VRGSGPVTRGVSLYDDAASVCDGAPARVLGSGTIDGDTLMLQGALACIPGGNRLRSLVTVGFVFDPSTGTLVDDFGVTWYRAG